MSAFKPTTAKTVTAVLRRYADWLDTQPIAVRKLTAVDINRHLDD